MSAEPMQVIPIRCNSAAAEWRTAAAWTAATAQTVALRCRQLMIDERAAGGLAYGLEVTEELRSAADLLEATVDAVQLVGFDVTGAQIGGLLSSVAGRLRRSLHDSVGLRPIDLDDPDPHRAHQTAHFGDVPLFGPGGPLATDVHQGSLGDCGLIAAIASIADIDPARIAGMISDHGDGTYTVHIDGVAITVDDEFPAMPNGVPVYAHGPAWTEPGALWPLVLEKAIAVHLGDGYSGLVRHDVERMFDLFGESSGLTIDRRLDFDASDAAVLDRIEQHLDAGLPVTATADEELGMGAAHAWSVVATGVSASGEATVTVRNPWGNTGFEVIDDRVERRHDDDVVEGVDPDDVHIDDDAGELTLPLSDFADEFREIDHLDQWDPA